MLVKRRRVLFLIGLTIASVAAVAVFYLLARKGIGIGCPLYHFTGLRCPGCGNSRAAIALFEGNLRLALKMNFLFPLEFGYLLWVAVCCGVSFLKNGRFQYHPRWAWVDGLILAVVVLWGICRNFWNI